MKLLGQKDKWEIHQAVLWGDTHVGCSLALMHPDGARLDNHNKVKPNDLQLRIHEFYDHSVREAIPELTEGEPFVSIHMGDMIDNCHHQSTHQWSQNTAMQKRHAVQLLRRLTPLEDKMCVKFYAIRGTEAHTGESGRDDEEIAEQLGAMPNRWGQFTRYILKIRLGGGLLVCKHHVGITSSQAYATSAPMRMLTEAYVNAARWGSEPPDALIFGHRHGHVRASVGTRKGDAIVATTPCWQGKTPHGHRVTGDTASELGFLVVRWNKIDGMYLRKRAWPIVDDEIEDPSKEDDVECA